MAEEEMRVNPQRAKELVENLASVAQKVQNASQKTSKNVRLVAVSKLKPATDILALHQQSPPQLHFGENYVQELEEKARLLPQTIRWHMIGALQTNKCKGLAEKVGNLWCVESVDTAKKADQLEKGRSKHDDAPEKLRILVQVNTSGEAEKSGCEPDEALALCKHIQDSCPHLQLQGLMTIGAIARSQATTAENENEDFIKLRDVRDSVSKELGIELELSMGMSADYEGAIAMGSDEVRVGSTIFGERPPKKEAKILEDTKDEKA